MARTDYSVSVTEFRIRGTKCMFRITNLFLTWSVFSAIGLSGSLLTLRADDDKTPAQTQMSGETSEKVPRLYSGFSGYTRRVTTSSSEAQQWFDQGIQLLYGFNHDEAIRSFLKASELDPSCAMAFWGAAYARGMHINNPEVSEQQSHLAWQESQRALQLLDNESPVECALVRAVCQRYEWPVPADRSQLNTNYADAMEAVWHQHPADPETGPLFAESLMNLQPWDLWTSTGSPKGRAMEIVAVLENSLSRFPDHPGANHFYIHAVEASPWPERAEAAAERLLHLVPGSGHLVHMPSHIFIRVGRYADASNSNQLAIDADEAYFSAAPQPDFYSLYYLHNLHFLAYSSMMEGRFETALAAARRIETMIPPEFLRNYVTLADGFMPTALHVLIRFGQWDAILAEPEPEAWRLLSRAERHFARAVAFAALRQPDSARLEIQQLQQISDGMTDDWKMGNNSAGEVLVIARLMAEGELAFAEGNEETAFELLDKAVQLEENLAYDEPPGWMQPVRHAQGALLHAVGRYVEAEHVYRADLKRHPKNAWSLLGLRQALKGQGKTEEADALSPDVQQAWSRSDIEPVASCFCHPDALRLRAAAGKPE